MFKCLISEKPLRSVNADKESSEEEKRLSSDFHEVRGFSNSVDYHSDTEAGKMLDEMQYFREKKFFCDITIVVGDKELEVIFRMQFFSVY